MLLMEPIVAALSLYVAFNFATIYSFFVAFPLVFQEVYSFTPEQSGLSFFSLVIGCLVGGLINIFCDKVIYQRLLRKSQQGSLKEMVPEMRLHSTIIGSILAPAGLFMFGWGAKRSIHWICPLIGGTLVAAGNVSIFTGILLYLVDTYESTLSASALAANGILRYVVGACLPLSTLRMYQRLHVDCKCQILVDLFPLLCCLARRYSRAMIAEKCTFSLESLVKKYTDSELLIDRGNELVGIHCACYVADSLGVLYLGTSA